MSVVSPAPSDMDEHGQQIVVDAEALGVVDDDRHAQVLREPHRHLVARLLDAEAQASRGRRSAPSRSSPASRCPGPGPCSISMGASSTIDGRLVAVVDRGRVDERLERGAGLALGLDGAVELAHGEGEAADDGIARGPCAGPCATRPPPTSGICISDQTPPSSLGVLRRNVDHVAERQHVADRLRRRLLGSRLGPLHLVEGDLDRLALVDERAVLLRARAAGRRSPWSARSSSTTPSRQGCDVAGTLDACRAPRPSRRRCRSSATGPRQPFSRSKSTRPSISARRAMRCRFGIERGAHGKAAVDRACPLAVGRPRRRQRAPHFLGEVVGGEDLRAESGGC